MILSPKYAIDQGWVTGIKNDCQIQPNAVEFTLDTMYTIDGNKTFTVYDDADGKTHKTHRGGEQVMPTTDYSKTYPFFWLSPGVYDCLSDVYVDLPEDVALKLIIRSTFNRNGLFITSGLYDSGYQGHIGCALHNWVGASSIGAGTRLGQAMFETADSEGRYAGGYNHEEGSHWAGK